MTDVLNAGGSTRLSWRCWLLNPSCRQKLGILSACSIFNFTGHFFWCYQWILFYLHVSFLLTLQELLLGSLSLFSSYLTWYHCVIPEVFLWIETWVCMDICMCTFTYKCWVIQQHRSQHRPVCYSPAFSSGQLFFAEQDNAWLLGTDWTKVCSAQPWEEGSCSSVCLTQQ